MFLGHFGVAFGMKRVEPKLSLATLFFATALVDLLWGVFLLTGWERAAIVPAPTPGNQIEFISYPITHSLAAAFGWGLLAAVIVYSWPTRDTSKHHWLKALVVALVVASHWFLDLVVHVRDLPLVGDDSTKYGFGLWRSIPATMAVELLLFGAGLFVYFRWRSRGSSGITWRVAVLAGLLLALFVASTFGPPPPSIRAIAIADIGGVILLVALAAWADRPLPNRARAGGESGEKHPTLSRRGR
ncbi:MAG TPA: hypothetical protein VGP80_09515 [Gemmatimonadales bacterium]|nr:hypothetical protein [Gemmatimonadales bacterium]